MNQSRRRSDGRSLEAGQRRLSEALRHSCLVRDFLAGQGDKYGAPAIDPEVGAPQEEIHAAYKVALHMAFAEDAAPWMWRMP